MTRSGAKIQEDNLDLTFLPEGECCHFGSSSTGVSQIQQLGKHTWKPPLGLLLSVYIFNKYFLAYVTGTVLEIRRQRGFWCPKEIIDVFDHSSAKEKGVVPRLGGVREAAKL